MKHSEQINELAAALAKAQAGIKNPKLNCTAKLEFKTGSHEYSYADLAAVWEAIREPLTANGLSIVQHPVSSLDEKGPVVDMTTILLHSSGQYFEDTLRMWPANESPHAIGSTVTYARRYGLCSIVGVCGDKDDDAGAGMGSPKQQPPQTQPKAPASAPAPRPTNPQAPPASAKPVQNAAQQKPKPAPVEINDSEQIKKGLINSTLIAELTHEVDKAQIKPHTFLCWLNIYTKQIADAGGNPLITQALRGMHEIPASNYGEFLSIVQKEPERIAADLEAWKNYKPKLANHPTPAAAGDDVTG
jgi:hypothetical protein